MRKVLIMATMIACLNSCVLDAKEGTTETDYDAQLLQQGDVAPALEISDNLHPEVTALSDLKGSYVVVEFWASWCPDCRKVMPTMVELYNTYGSDSVKFVGISYDRDTTTWKNYVEQNQMTWIQSAPRDRDASGFNAAWKVNWIPTFYVIDKEGKVVIGTVNTSKLAEELTRIKN